VPGLTTTSYAILGLLDLRPHTAYELAAQSSRSLRFAWPTAPSRLYAEPKRLAAEGLIEITTEPIGPERSRQVFRITAAGRRALRAWLRTPPAPPSIEAEALLRTLLAHAGRPDDLMGALEATREHTLAQYTEGRAIVDAYAEGRVEYPEHLHQNLLWMVFVRELLQLVHDWTHFAQEEAAGWRSDADRGSTARAQELLRELADGEPTFPRRPMAPSHPSEAGSTAERWPSGRRQRS
jgi:PadR family transcriptional regulator AphA